MLHTRGLVTVAPVFSVGSRQQTSPENTPSTVAALYSRRKLTRHSATMVWPSPLCHDSLSINLCTQHLIPAMPLTLIGLLATAAYLTASVLLLLRARALDDAPPRLPAIGLGGLAVLLHALVLGGLLFSDAGLNMDFSNAISLAGWLIATLLILVTLNQPVENLGIVLLPIAALGLLLQLFVPLGEPVYIAVSSPIQAHIVLSILAYGTLSLAAVQSVLLVIQDRRLHNHNPGGFLRGLPPLRIMENLLFHMIGVGFALLSLSLFSGALFLEDIWAQHLLHKTVLSIIAWMVFFTLLWGRWQYGWRGRKAIYWTLAGFILLMLAYFGSKLVLEIILQR